MAAQLNTHCSFIHPEFHGNGLLLTDNPESLERQEGAARSQQPQPHGSSSRTKTSNQCCSARIHQTQAEFLHHPHPGGAAVHPSRDLGSQMHSCTSPLPQTTHRNSSISLLFTGGKVQLWDVTGKKRHSQKKRDFQQSQQKLFIVIFSAICLVESHGIMPWMEEGPMKPG